eukprot:COSAG04_NODE_2396_length_4211_cov_95.846060_4_plen_187_part_00
MLTVGAQPKRSESRRWLGGYHDAPEGADLDGREAALRQRNALLARERKPLTTPLLFKSTHACQDERMWPRIGKRVRFGVPSGPGAARRRVPRPGSRRAAAAGQSSAPPPRRQTCNPPAASRGWARAQPPVPSPQIQSGSWIQDERNTPRFQSKSSDLAARGLELVLGKKDFQPKLPQIRENSPQFA